MKTKAMQLPKKLKELIVLHGQRKGLLIYLDLWESCGKNYKKEQTK